MGYNSKTELYSLDGVVCVTIVVVDWVTGGDVVTEDGVEYVTVTGVRVGGVEVEEDVVVEAEEIHYTRWKFVTTILYMIL